VLDALLLDALLDAPLLDEQQFLEAVDVGNIATMLLMMMVVVAPSE